MTSLKDFAEANVPVERETHPNGWEPSVTWNGTSGVLSTGPLDKEPDAAIWDVLIKDWGLNPTTTEVVDGSVQVRGWDANVGKGVIKRMFYYRASIRARGDEYDRADIESIIADVKKRKPAKTKNIELTFDGALVVTLSDWQIGKGEGGGTAATVDRIKQSVTNLTAYIKQLSSVGRSPSALYLIGLGDIVEGCSEFYALQTFTVDLDRREQKRVARHLLLWIVDTLLPLGLLIVIGGVPGNHGENRKGGKAFTSLTDNDDLAAFEELAELLSMNPERYGNVHVPNGAIADDLTMTLEVAGVVCGFAHGHQIKGGGSGSQGKIESWWKGQALGRQRVADADILFTGHLHHFVISESTGRTMIQSPAQDGGSQWYVGTSGQHSASGMLVVGVGTGYGSRGWGDLVLL